MLTTLYLFVYELHVQQASGGTLQGSVLVSRKSSSTPSLSEAVEPKLTVASTDQVASAENLTSSSSSEPVSSEYVFLYCCHV